MCMCEPGFNLLGRPASDELTPARITLIVHPRPTFSAAFFSIRQKSSNCCTICRISGYNQGMDHISFVRFCTRCKSEAV